MQRFTPTVGRFTLQNKAIEEISQARFTPPSTRRCDIRIASSLGMDADGRAALQRITALARSGSVGVIGRFMPSADISAHLAALGISENIEEADFFRYHSLVIPYNGLALNKTTICKSAGQRLEDLTSPAIKRAIATLNMLRRGNARLLVIGRHNDSETRVLASQIDGTMIIEETTDTARLRFSPSFGAVCQTSLSPRRVHWISQQLRMRWHDARVNFLDTVSPAMNARERALEALLANCCRAVIVGETGESTTDALAETALRLNKPCHIVSSADQLKDTDLDLRPNERIAFTAGAYTTDDTLRDIARSLLKNS